MKILFVSTYTNWILRKKSSDTCKPTRHSHLPCFLFPISYSLFLIYCGLVIRPGGETESGASSPQYCGYYTIHCTQKTGITPYFLFRIYCGLAIRRGGEPGSGASSPQYCGDYTIYCTQKKGDYPLFLISYLLWPRQESNLDLELRKLLYYPLYYEANISMLPQL